MKHDLAHIAAVYFIGIGGIGMSAIARFFNNQSVLVYGYDKTKSALTKQLEEEGIKITYDDTAELPPEFMKYNAKNLVVYTPAIPSTNQKVVQLKEHYPIFKRSEVLGMLSRYIPTLAVAGTHGKTTTSILLAHIFKTAKKPLVAFLGGISKNYHTNFLYDENPQILITEADEYDRSFLTLHPEKAIITSTDPDHLDIYHHANQMIEAYQLFANQVKQDIVTKPEQKNQYNSSKATISTYAVQESTIADAKMQSYKVVNHKPNVRFCWENNEFTTVLNFPGLHNAENTLAASYLAWLSGVSISDIKLAIQTFKGVKRRFDFQINTPKLVYIDDYAHHPTEVTACINSVRQLYPNKKVSVIFQPHLYSRTRDFYKEFASALDLADEVWLLPIYPAREEPIEGVSSQLIAEATKSNKTKVIDKSSIKQVLQQHKIELLLTLGAGDIDKEVANIKEILHSNEPV